MSNSNPIIPHELFIEHLLPLIFSAKELEDVVLNAVITRNLRDLRFFLGRNKASVPSYLKRNDLFTRQANFTILLPVLVDLGFSLSAEIFEAAATRGNLSLLKWLKEKRCPWSPWTFYYASEYGDLVNMQWLRENGCPWNEETFTAAARNGKLENMIWLKQNGCPWDARTFYYAEDHGNLINIRWLISNGCPRGRPYDEEDEPK
jgi:hypothetical protein